MLSGVRRAARAFRISPSLAARCLLRGIPACGVSFELPLEVTPVPLPVLSRQPVSVAPHLRERFVEGDVASCG